MLGANKAYFIAHYYLIYRPEEDKASRAALYMEGSAVLKCWCLAHPFQLLASLSMPCQKWRELTRNPRSRQQVKKQSCMQGSILLFVVQRQIYSVSTTVIFAVELGAVTTYASHKGAADASRNGTGTLSLYQAFNLILQVLYRQASHDEVSLSNLS